MKKKTYAVGYGKPPQHSRFRPGQSGNPKGRPKGARGIAAELAAELKQPVEVTENGRRRKLPKQTVMLKTLVNKAVKGEAKALQTVLNICFSERGAVVDDSQHASIRKLILDEYVRRRMEAGRYEKKA